MAIDTTLTDARGFTWDFASDWPMSIGGGNGVGFALVDGQNDTVDGGFGMRVNGTFFNPSNGATSGASVGTEFTTVAVLIGGIAVQRSVAIETSVGYGFGRFLDMFTNATNVTQTITVDIGIDSGADRTLVVPGTTSGDGLITTADTGFVFDDANLSGEDTALTYVYGDGLGLMPSAVSLVGDLFTLTYTLTLAPGETKSLLSFASQNPTAADALRYVEIFRDTSNFRAYTLDSGLTAAETRTIVNYSGFNLTTRLTEFSLTDAEGNRWTVDELGRLSTTDTTALRRFDIPELTSRYQRLDALTADAETGEVTLSLGGWAPIPGSGVSYAYRPLDELGIIRLVVTWDIGPGSIAGHDLNPTITTGYGINLSSSMSGVVADGPNADQRSSVVLDDSGGASNGRLPALTFAFGATSAGESSFGFDGVFVVDWSEGVFGPNEVRKYLFFFAVNETGTQALADLAATNDPGPQALVGLSDADLALIRNYSLDRSDRLEVIPGTDGDDVLNGNPWGDSITGGLGDDVIDANGSDDEVEAGGGDDSVLGEGGDDVIGGGAGDDEMDGGAGADTLFGGEGDDLLLGGFGQDYLQGDEGADELFGGGEADVLFGGAGHDTLRGGLGNDTMLGGAGNDVYIVTEAGDVVVEALSQGSRTDAGGIDLVRSRVSFSLDATGELRFVENLTLTGSASINATGNALANVLIGNGAANRLEDGLGAADTLIGGAGNDTYVVRNAGTRIEEGAGQGTSDTVTSSTSFALAADDHIEVMATTSARGTTAINLTGNALAQRIVGNAGANRLEDGLGAADTLVGGAGNDTYVVRNGGTRIDEGAGQGTADTVAASTSFVLAADDHIEVLSTTSSAGTAAIDLTGNALAQRIVGNAGANRLEDGLGAADTLIGGAGNDTYVVRNAGTRIDESAGQGTADTVAASTSFALAADDHIEVLTTTTSAGTAAINLTGNALAQRLVGNAGANQLNGGAGSDTLTGGGGADIFVFSTAPGAINADRITDFDPVADTIRLDDAVFAGLATGTQASGVFARITTGQTPPASARLIHDTTDGKIYHDADGGGAGARVHFATVSLGLNLTAADFFVF